jgi:hypothetical protein
MGLTRTPRARAAVDWAASSSRKTPKASSMSLAVPNWKGPSPSATPHLVPRGSGLVVPDPSVPHHFEQVSDRVSDGGVPRLHMRRNSGLMAKPGPDSGTRRPLLTSLRWLRSLYQPQAAQAIIPRRKSLSPL